ncbi:MAG: DNA polymerase III subunit alpha, partial [Deltaproteobacteria bacterium]|nr:DNA polymerase III subunit alpha [Deltaproteobacteria bacterium]
MADETKPTVAQAATEPDPFVHLHVHSQYSMLDGAMRLPELVKAVKARGMSAVALTDHHNMFGTLTFYEKCKEAGIKPIIGCEVHVTPGRMDDPDARGHYHLTLLAKDQEGYRDLVRLVSLGYVRGLSGGRPRVDLETLASCSRGLVALTGCMGGLVAQQVLESGREAGETMTRRLLECFGDDRDRVFVELQDHGFPEQQPLNELLADIAARTSLRVVATNDCHYLGRADAHAQLVLACIGSGVALVDAERAHHGSSDIYLKTGAEMRERFAAFPEALEVTRHIADDLIGKVDPTHKAMLPHFALPEGYATEEELFRKLAHDGLEARFAESARDGRDLDVGAYRARLAMELDVIAGMQFPGYFLVVQDFINWAKRAGVPVGPGRGSGAGSIVAWALRITNLDPIRYGLLFERFLNPERVSMPDFDIDFCMDRRDEVIGYVKTKYGEQSVGQIATFHLLKSRSVVRDVGRVMGMTPPEAGRIATLVPEPIQGKSVPIKDALEQEPRLRELYTTDARAKELLDTAMKLENLTRHAGMHAAGIVISEGALWDHVPVFTPEPGVLVTQYAKDEVERAGLVKFDFLGLRTLTVIDHAVRIIRRRPDQGTDVFDVDRIPLDDEPTFELLRSGETTNVFQLESSGMQGLFKQLRPDRFEDIVAAVALYRPGPLEAGLVSSFVARKNGKEKIESLHPSLDDVLGETYGVIVYQEQVMQAAQILAGYSLGSADLLRRAMGKKKLEEMVKQREGFVEGSVARGLVERSRAGEIFDIIEKFAGYGFNKSHSAAYALLTYQTAYLKAHYPCEFVCATLTADKDKNEKVVRTVAEGRAIGIEILAPDVNESEADFSVVYAAANDVAAELDQPTMRRRASVRPRAQKDERPKDPLRPKIRFGLGAVKGVGGAAIDAIFEARREGPFQDLFDFSARVDVRRVNRGVLEALIQCGAFDSVLAGATRAQAFAAIDLALERGRKMAADRASGQTSLFGLLDAPAAREASTMGATYPRAEPWDSRELLARER